MHKGYTKYKLILCVRLRSILGTTQDTYANILRLKKTKPLKCKMLLIPSIFKEGTLSLQGHHFLFQCSKNIHSGVVHLKGPAVEDLTATAQKTDARNQWQFPSQS